MPLRKRSGPFLRLFLLLCVSLLGHWALAQIDSAPATLSTDTQISKSSKKTEDFSAAAPKKWTRFRPFVPSVRDYSVETGIMFEDSNLYWLGGSIGWHLGRCVMSQSQTCQQYIDLLGGVGGRDGLTNGMAAVSVRWQFIKVPNYFSPSVRIFGGVMNINGDDRKIDRLLLGAGYGISMAVDKRVDMKFEVRAGVADKVWSQAFISFGFRMDEWLNYFSRKLKGLGQGTLDATGKVFNYIKTGGKRSDKSKNKEPKEKSNPPKEGAKQKQ